ncbi:hypothetical protein C0991_010841 [Blastosporella zonata]|nr:hypothetical protein C0991_010841 [Blastosporella zonata]
MATYQPVRMPSSEWTSKDKSPYDRNPFRNQASPSPRPSPRASPSPRPVASAGTVPSAEKSAPGPVTSSQAKEPGKASAVERASETVKPYLPGSVAAYLPASATANQSPLPSKEIPGGSKVGVGSLPGNLSEASVAKLPEERAMEARQQQASAKAIHHRKANKSAKHVGKPSTSPSMLQSAMGYLPESVAAYLPLTTLAGGAPADSPLPSKEKPSGSAGGVGSLPGNYSEISVAKTPEERRLEVMPSHETDHEILGKTGGVGPLPGGPNESRVAMLPEERIHPQSPDDSYPTGAKGLEVAGLGVLSGGAAAERTAQREGESSRIGETTPSTPSKLGTTVSGMQGGSTQPDVRSDPGYHPATLHPPDPKLNKEAEVNKEAEARSHASTSQPTNTSVSSGVSAERRSTSGSEGSTGERHKVGFMEKVKGEAKVISGKLGHNEKKIEEDTIEQGAKVTAHYNSSNKNLDSVRARYGEKVQALQADLTIESAVAQLFVNASSSLPVVQMSLEQWKSTIDVNLTASFLVCREFLKGLQGASESTKNCSSILFIGSSSGKFGEKLY